MWSTSVARPSQCGACVAAQHFPCARVMTRVRMVCQLGGRRAALLLVYQLIGCPLLGVGFVVRVTLPGLTIKNHLPYSYSCQGGKPPTYNYREEGFIVEMVPDLVTMCATLVMMMLMILDRRDKRGE